MYCGKKYALEVDTALLNNKYVVETTNRKRTT